MAPEKSKVEINGFNMAYQDFGKGQPIVFLHGNPTSSYLWRNIIPYAADLGRVVVPDLIGMGDSDKLSESGPGTYTFADHKAYLDGFFEAILQNEKDIIFVLHDWGSALGFHWAHRHAERVAGLAFMEAIIEPFPDWQSFPEAATAIFQAMRSPAGEELVLEKNIFVERILPGSILRQLSKVEHDEYRRPYLQAGESRRPTLTWPRQIPIEGEPNDVTALVNGYATWLDVTPIPKLFIDADPGAIIQDWQKKRIRTWSNLTEDRVAGIHFIQEDSPDEIGTILNQWIRGL